jgi:hypothetical protein
MAGGCVEHAQPIEGQKGAFHPLTTGAFK